MNCADVEENISTETTPNREEGKRNKFYANNNVKNEFINCLYNKLPFVLLESFFPNSIISRFIFY